MHVQHHLIPTERVKDQRRWRPAAPALLLLSLLGSADAVRARAVQTQQRPSQLSPSEQAQTPQSASARVLLPAAPTRGPLLAQAPYRPLLPFQDSGSGTSSQTPGSPQPLPVQPPGWGAGGRVRQQLQQLSPSQQQQLFAREKQMQLRFLRDRMQLLQSGERCLTAATSLDQLRNCKREERQTNMELRRKHVQEMRTTLQRFGITVPERPGKGGRWGGGAGGPQQPEGPGHFGPGPGSRGEPI